MQAGIWEIIYEHGPSFSLTGGTFKGAPEEAAGQGAFDIVNGFLMNLGAYRADARIDVLRTASTRTSWSRRFPSRRPGCCSAWASASSA